MTNNRFPQLGWLLFGCVAIVALSGGFQTPTEKIGVADMAQMVDASDFGKAFKDQSAQMSQARQGILEFIDTNRVLTFEQASRIRELSLKQTSTDAEKAELESIKAQVIAANKRWKELATKPNMTPEERTLVEEYATRAQKMNELGPRWLREFTNDMDDWQVKQKTEAFKRARASIQEVGKAQGFTVVLDGSTAPYGANDITDACLQAMNAKK